MSEATRNTGTGEAENKGSTTQVMMGEALLAELGYEVTSRTSSRQTLDLPKQDPSRFDLVITDQTMPGITGVEPAGEILGIRPGIPVILCGSNTDYSLLFTYHLSLIPLLSTLRE
jgi:CheY-like chemotaxis protein